MYLFAVLLQNRRWRPFIRKAVKVNLYSQAVQPFYFVPLLNGAAIIIGVGNVQGYYVQVFIQGYVDKKPVMIFLLSAS